MADYISREAVLADLSTAVEKGGMGQIIADTLMRYVKRQPAADVVPVRHGRFVHEGPRFARGVDLWQCSSCGRLVSDVETRFDYCPWCGAKMEEGGEDG